MDVTPDRCGAVSSAVADSTKLRGMHVWFGAEQPQTPLLGEAGHGAAAREVTMGPPPSAPDADVVEAPYSLFQLPRLRPPGTRVLPNWSEVALDLIFVGIAGLTDQFLRNQLHDRYAEWLVFIFVMFLYWAWSDCTFWFTRFERGHDCYTSLALFVYLFGCVGMGMFTRLGWDGRRQFSMAVTVTRIGLLLLYLPVALFGKRLPDVGKMEGSPQALALLWSIVAIVEACAWGIVAWGPVPDYAILGFWMAQVPLIFFRANLPSLFRATHLRLDDSHVAERHNRFVLIFVGQAVLSLLSVDPPDTMTLSYVVTMIAGFLLVMSLVVMFLTGQRGHAHPMHALRRNWFTRKMFVCQVPILGAAVLGVSAPLRIQIASASSGAPSSFRSVVLMSLSTGVFILLDSIGRALHRFRPSSTNICARLFALDIIASLIGTLRFFPKYASPTLAVASLAFAGSVIAIADAFRPYTP
ncbi:Low temperature requirement protein A [Plasmodiophora brassicae]|uniref:Low temperature requirement protein A n=1 Tax=Plasmodiophora brassicae TaxID=37360 RepID=A0A0G4IT52_PLABS|nr:hypothetical protein PBRA_006438 [Plasmodiophora brassicae]